MDQADWIVKYWSAVWGIFVYFYYVYNELCLGIARHSREIKFEKLKTIGPDLYKISVVVWGVLLVDINSDNVIATYIGKIILLRFLVLIGLLAVGQGVSKLNHEEKHLIKNFRGWKKVAVASALNLGLQVIGLGSLLLALSIIYRG